MKKLKLITMLTLLGIFLLLATGLVLIIAAIRKHERRDNKGKFTSWADYYQLTVAYEKGEMTKEAYEKAVRQLY